MKLHDPPRNPETRPEEIARALDHSDYIYNCPFFFKN